MYYCIPRSKLITRRQKRETSNAGKTRFLEKHFQGYNQPVGKFSANFYLTVLSENPLFNQLLFLPVASSNFQKELIIKYVYSCSRMCACLPRILMHTHFHILSFSERIRVYILHILF